MNTGTETHSIARNEQRQVSIHGSRNLFRFRVLVLSTLLSVIYGEGDRGWHLMVAHGVFVSLWAFFLSLSGSDIG